MNSAAWILVGLAAVLLLAVAAVKVIEARRHYRQFRDNPFYRDRGGDES